MGRPATLSTWLDVILAGILLSMALFVAVRLLVFASTWLSEWAVWP